METSTHRREDVWVIQEHNQTTGCYRHKHKQGATGPTTTTGLEAILAEGTAGGGRVENPSPKRDPNAMEVG